MTNFYSSRGFEMELEPRFVFNIVNKLYDYVDALKLGLRGADRDIPKIGGRGRRLILQGGFKKNPKSQEEFGVLAELVLSEDSERLTFRVRGNAELSVDSEELKRTVDGYDKKSQKNNDFYESELYKRVASERL